jgi:hypothetical protein
LDDHFEPVVDGIVFEMLDRQGRPVRCFVTSVAITVRMGRSPSQEEKVAWFQVNRSEVEAIASRKFDAAMVEVSGDYRVRVNTIDLNINRSG